MSTSIDPEICSCNEEIDSFVVGDNTVELTGAIIKLDKPRIRSSAQNERKMPVRYVLSNLSGRELRVLFWPPRAAEFEGRLLHQIITISRARVVESNALYRNENENLMNIEISIQANTKIEILGPAPKEPKTIYSPITLGEAASSIGKNIWMFCFDVYIKTKIENVPFNNFSYGSGAVTDLTYRLPLNVTTFSENGNPEKGSYVKINGQIRTNKLGTILLQVESMENIEILKDTVKLDLDMKTGC